MRKSDQDMSHDEFQERVTERRQVRMAQIDKLSPDMRSLVHDYGWTVVDAFIRNGVTKPNALRHLVETVLNEFSPTRGSSSSQGARAAFGIKSTEAAE